MLEIDIDELSQDTISEIRILLRSPGWKLFQDIVRAQRYGYLDDSLNKRPAPGESLETFALSEFGDKRYQAGLLFALELPQNIIDNLPEEETEVEEDE